MDSRISKFQKLASIGGIKLALLRTVEYIRRELYGPIGISSYIQSKLLIGGPATPLHALYVKICGLLIGVNKADGIDVMDKDWDNLILLDSYRADSFREHSSLEGNLSTFVSQGTWSLEFIVNNFKDSKFHDTVVVTANPYYQKYQKLDQDTFHSIKYCEKTEGMKSFNQVTKRAIEASEEFPNKRLIVHYMKPHAPHVGETSDIFRKKFGDVFPGMFLLYRSGVISKPTLKQSYVDTIDIIEPKVRDLVDNIDGKSVVSSDHGENLGEKYFGLTQVGHGNPTPECYNIPWLEMDYNKRREITEEQPTDLTPTDEEALENSLRALGYQ